MVASADTTRTPSVIRFYDYQREFFADDSRVQVAIWCRQAGKDFTTACKAVDNALRTGQAWYIVSLTQRQADATFAKCKQVAAAFKHALQTAGETRYDEREYEEYVHEIDHRFRCTARTLHLPGGGSVTSLPGRNPDTLAGLTGNVILTEFGLFPGGGYDHWRVVFPLSTRGFKVIVISTPRGKNTKLFDLVSDPDTYSIHFVDIHRAVADGMPLKGNDGRDVTVEQFRQFYGDEVGWAREFLCQFTGDLEALVKWAMLMDAGSHQPPVATFCRRIEGEAGWVSGYFKAIGTIVAHHQGRCEIGWDVARHGHLSALWINGARGQFGQHRRLLALVLMHQTSFGLQRQVVTEAMDCAHGNVGCGDATGLGMDSNETLQARYGGRWEPVMFTAGSKRDLASGLLTSYDDREQRLPPANGELKFIHTDIYALQADRSGGTLKVTETVNPLLPESHCDIAFANALARRAGGLNPSTFRLTVAQ